MADQHDLVGQGIQAAQPVEAIRLGCVASNRAQITQVRCRVLVGRVGRHCLLHQRQHPDAVTSQFGEAGLEQQGYGGRAPMTASPMAATS